MDLSTQPTLRRCCVREIRDVRNVPNESGACVTLSWWDDRWERGRQPRPRWCWRSSASAAAERTRGLFGRLVNWAGISASGPVCSARRPVCSPRKVGSGTPWCQARPDPGPMPSIRWQSPSGRLKDWKDQRRTLGLPGIRRPGLVSIAFLRISMNFSSCSLVRSARMRTLDFT